MPTLTYSTTLTVVTCGSCGIPHAIPADRHAKALKDGSSWYCPNGHKISYHESENDRLRRLLKSEEAYAVHQRDQRVAAERSAAAYKGQATRLRKRVAAGVCPCCNRTFQNLGRHMSGQHPGFAEATA